MLPLKKVVWIVAFGSIAAGCTDDNADETGLNSNEDLTAENENTEANNNDRDGDDTEELTANHILERSHDTYRDITDVYYHTVSKVRETEENGDTEETTEIKYWEFVTEDGHHMRRIERTENDGPTEYTITIEEGRYMLTYTAGDDTAYVRDRDEDAAYGLGGSLSNVSDREDASIAGTGEVNGYEAYHISFTGTSDLSDYWIDQDTYYIVRQEQLDHSPYTETDTIDYDLEPDYNPELFDVDYILPDGVELSR
ncbi:outer membrane lipoprotein-sorting protein [Salipaludibacillus sp. CUR1]|uniref:outer membrane lipoprotein-sorting protein n=1 Tax=Salipaludibacillus sp. CUR1 TaxID=2820003 RepID=UPI001E463B7B|nr:outer membrane lipoprotein-sorting protein [Salipaludibacillus sp. CUR1]MCE7792059.1 outer membrane lipoprotein-sorting protein [Salipaludibacillus sp. CUR1]